MRKEVKWAPGGSDSHPVLRFYELAEFISKVMECWEQDFRKTFLQVECLD